MEIILKLTLQTISNPASKVKENREKASKSPAESVAIIFLTRVSLKLVL